MSLLLDALQRASKEKEKLAEAKLAESRANGANAESVLTPSPVARPSFPDLSLEALSPAPATRQDGPESLSLELEPLRQEGTVIDGGNLIEPARYAPQEPEILFPRESSNALQAPASSVLSSARPEGSSAQLVSDAPQQPLSIDAQLALTTTSVPTQDDSRPASRGVPNSAEQLEPQKATPSITEVGTATPATNETNVKARSQVADTAGVPSSKIAREILAANAKPPRKVSPRLIGLGVAVFLAAGGYGAFFLGLFDRLLGTPDTVLGTGVPIAPPPATAQPPANESAATVQATADGPRKESGVVAAASQAKLQSASVEEARADDTKAGANKETSTSVPANRARMDKAKPAARQARAPIPVVIARKPDISPLDRAYSALIEERFEEAGTAYRQALEKNAGERDALLGLAYIAHRRGNLDEARTHYQQVLRLDPGQTDALAGLLSIAADGDLAGAASRAREMADRAPESAVALATFGGILVREGRIAEAQQAYFKALALEPENALHAYNLAVSLDRLHKYSQAKIYYLRALVLTEKPNAVSSGFSRREVQLRLEQLRVVDNAEASRVVTEAPRN